jgi:hypothetical protein
MALLLSGCVTRLQITGPYAATLCDADVHQMRQLAGIRPHIGRTVIALQTIRPDRVHVETRHYKESGWSGISFFAIRRGHTWHTDDHAPIEGIGERTIITY